MALEKDFHFHQIRDRSSEEALLSGQIVADDYTGAHEGGKLSRMKQINLCSLAMRYGLLLHLTFFLVYITIFVYTQASGQLRDSNDWQLKTPARSSIHMESRNLKNAVDSVNPFKGPPSPELDLAWHNLLRNSNIRLTAEELRKMNRTSVQLADGSGEYAASLDIYHQLHCLKYIRHYVHPEYYDIVKTNVPSVDHVDHCIDSLRQLVMCRADASIQTYEWIPTLRIPWAKFDQTEHECTNWEALDSWAAGRSFDLYDPKMLQHPTLGTSFPKGWYKEQKLEHTAEQRPGNGQ